MPAGTRVPRRHSLSAAGWSGIARRRPLLGLRPGSDVVEGLNGVGYRGVMVGAAVAQAPAQRHGSWPEPCTPGPPGVQRRLGNRQVPRCLVDGEDAALHVGLGIRAHVSSEGSSMRLPPARRGRTTSHRRGGAGAGPAGHCGSGVLMWGCRWRLFSPARSTPRHRSMPSLTGGPQHGSAAFLVLTCRTEPSGWMADRSNRGTRGPGLPMGSPGPVQHLDLVDDDVASLERVGAAGREHC